MKLLFALVLILGVIAVGTVIFAVVNRQDDIESEEDENDEN